MKTGFVQQLNVGFIVQNDLSHVSAADAGYIEAAAKQSIQVAAADQGDFRQLGGLQWKHEQQRKNDRVYAYISLHGE